jgi:hypothetical protein
MRYFEDQNFFSNAGVGKINKNLNIEYQALRLFQNDFDGQIRTSHLAQHTADTRFRGMERGLFLRVHNKNLLGTEMNADAAPLAPLPVDDNFL